jgi:magnesium-protoporphyrin O-methyltransferase
MSESCQCQGIEQQFDRRHVAAKLEQYRRRGPAASTRHLVEALVALGIDGMTLLDIGGGVGAIQHALLRAGVREAVSVEASTAYLEAARGEAARLGLGDRIVQVPGDFVDLADRLADADVVTLDRVICCYDDMERLVGSSVERARRLYGVVYPRDTWWVRAAMAIWYNARYRLRRNPMRNFIYRTADVEATIRRHGFERLSHLEMGAWQVAVFGRGPEGIRVSMEAGSAPGG